jgi:molybdate transport system substrate-binding protein
LSPLVLIGLLAGCSADESRTEIRVSAASSLTEVFIEIEDAFEEANPHYDVVLNLGSSSLLREQILAGAPVDVYASADELNMDLVLDSDLLVGAPRAFATNRMEIVVPNGNPGGVRSLEDFGRSDLLLGVCARGVPCGDLARQILDRAGVILEVHSEEPNVRSVLTKVQAGELDAGIVYVSDVKSSSGAIGITIADEVNVITTYPVAAVRGGSNQMGGLGFIDFLLSETGQTILRSKGFGSS